MGSALQGGTGKGGQENGGTGNMAWAPERHSLGHEIPASDRPKPTISVVIPALNEARNLEHVLSRLPRGVDEILLVDGHSVDDTVEVAKRMRPDIKVLVQRRRGKGNALACGFAAADGDIIVMVDADGSADPGEIPAFIEALTNGADYAKGSRFLPGGGSDDITQVRRLGNKALVGLVNVLFHTDYTDLCYGYNAFWRDCLPLFDLPCLAEDEPHWGDGFEIETLLNLRMAREGAQVAEVASVEGVRLYGDTHLNAARDGLRVLRTIVRERLVRRVGGQASLQRPLTSRRRRSRRLYASPRSQDVPPSDDCCTAQRQPVSLQSNALAWRSALEHQRNRIGARSPRARPGGGETTARPEKPTVCVVGPGWLFTSGVSYYTCHLTNAFAQETTTSALLMRRLLPRRLYPGAARVGVPVSDLRYRSDVDVFDGVDWCWVPSIAQALTFLLRRRPDFVVLQWWSGTVLHTYRAIAWCARLIDARIVIEFHEVLDTGEAALPLVNAYVRRGIRPLLAHSVGFAVHSEFDRGQLARHYGIPPDRVIVVNHGPFDHLARGATTDQRAARGDDDALRILFFGVIRPYKGLENLIEAFNGLDQASAERLTLTVVGETWEGWTRPAQLIAQSPYRERIEFINRYVTDEEAHAFFSSADAVVLPYLRSSASGPLHQAMSYGLPVVVSRVGGLTEVAAAYTGAVLVPPGDVDALRTALYGLAEERSPHRFEPPPFTWESSVAAFMDLFGAGREVPPPAGIKGAT